MLKRPFEKVKLLQRFEHSPLSALRCCAGGVCNFSKDAFLLLFFKLIRILLEVIVLFQSGTATTLSELGFRSSTCNCGQSLRMVFRWETGGLIVPPSVLMLPPLTVGSRHFLLFRLHFSYVVNSPILPDPSNYRHQLSGHPFKTFIS